MSTDVRIRKGKTVVGNVETTVAVVVKTPECDKLLAVSDKSQTLADFLEWLRHDRRPSLVLCELDEPRDEFYPSRLGIEQLLAEYFHIDLNKVEDERRALLEAIRL
jgi:hypothetical protein